MKRSIRFLAIFIILSGLVSCDNVDTPAPLLVLDPVKVLDPVPVPFTAIFNATLNGASEVPSNTSTATGSAVLAFNTTTKIFSLTVTYNGLTPTEGHIHVGTTGVAGPIVFALTGLTSPITYTSPPLTTAQEADLKEGRYYVNLHTTAFPGGEIRGQFDNLACEGCWDY
ncbi:CHRD domain-containing protein [Flavobacterium sp. LT1R49]|uniref:CHRD domain-containing protein n=1 Tax=Flavobacterium arabinosi TaxID=3398737 RepID=UPI003A861AFB